MKKLFLAFFTIILLPNLVQAQNLEGRTTISFGSQEIIRSFDVSAELDDQRNLIITENIEYDFGDKEKHGVYRYIPETYIRDGYTYSLSYDVESILRDGVKEPYQKSREADALMLKIGDADKTIVGKHVYTIKYKTSQAINFFKDGHAELYWNVTGNEWPVKIAKATFFLKSPLGNNTNVMFTCFTGVFGSVEQSCKLESLGDGLYVSADRILDKQEGVTVVFGFPPGMISKETWGQMMFRILRDNIILFVPLIALLGMLYLWFTKGKDPDPEIVIPEYEAPNNMHPLVLSGALGNGAIPMKGITATIIEMARKGYLHIEYKTKKTLFSEKIDYTFVKKERPNGNGIQPWEYTLWDGMFDAGRKEKVTIPDLTANKFYTDVQSAVKQASKILENEHIFVSNPYVVRSLYLVGAVLAFVVVRVAAGIAPVGTLAAFATGVIIAVFGWFMPKRTQEGTKLVAKVKGFKWFLSVTEEERLKFHNAPARTPEQFMEFLPAAIALGVEKQWAEQFKDLQMQPPEWAEGDVHMLSTVGLVSAISDMHTQTASSAFSPPSSSGSGGSGFSGGGSGGGGGGGGGGSW